MGAFVALVLVAGILGAVTSGQCLDTAETVGEIKGVPKKLVPIYQQAAIKYKLGAQGPAILASINFHETAFGTNLSTSSAGAQGWMQFMPNTWGEPLTHHPGYGVDANEDGQKDPNNPWDAIFAAANYLKESGAPKDWHRAIFAYNHAEWYVSMVLKTAGKYATGDTLITQTPVGFDSQTNSCTCGSQTESAISEPAISGSQWVFPLPKGTKANYIDSWGADRSGRGGIHEGTDLMTKAGTPILAVASGTVSQSGWNHLGGWRVGITDSRGIYHYYAHMRTASPLKVGKRVQAGQTIGEVGRTGEGPVGHIGGFDPHLHYGLYDRKGAMNDTSKLASDAVNPYPYLKAAEGQAIEAVAQCAGIDSGSGSSGPMIWPVVGSITGTFGEDRGDHMHSGLDIAAPQGRPVKAAASGTVAATTGWQGGYGNAIDLDHSDKLSTKYAHLSKILVDDGEAVRQGQTIGEVGNTGHSFGAHLHFEVKVGGTAKNPKDYLPRKQTN